MSFSVGHFSDLHGHYELIGRVPDSELPDVWLCTGDFFPNTKTAPGESRLIIPEREMTTQLRWWSYKGQSIVSRLRSKPLLWMPGNHDYIDLAKLLIGSGYPAHAIPVEGMNYKGKRWAGFREINWIKGEWNAEARTITMVDRCEELFANPFDILVTHAPPANILDGEENEPGSHYGVGVLRSNLEYRPNQVTHHFFGHCHYDGGKMEEHFGIKFYNGAEHVKVHRID